MLAIRWNQHRMRRLWGNTEVTALIRPGAPSAVREVGILRPQAIMLRKNSVQQASDSLFPTARWSRTLRPSVVMHQAARTLSLAPCLRRLS